MSDLTARQVAEAAAILKVTLKDLEYEAAEAERKQHKSETAGYNPMALGTAQGGLVIARIFFRTNAESVRRALWTLVPEEMLAEQEQRDHEKAQEAA